MEQTSQHKDRVCRGRLLPSGEARQSGGTAPVLRSPGCPVLNARVVGVPVPCALPSSRPAWT